MVYRRESGRLRHQEKSFTVEMGGRDVDPKYALECTHGWYHERRIGSTRRQQCVKCGKPEAECEAELVVRKAAELEARREAQRDRTNEE